MGRLCYPTTAPGRVLVPRVLGARKLSRCKEGMAHFLPSRYKFYLALRVSRYKFDRSREFIPGYKDGGGYWCSVAVQFVSKPEICQGAGFKLRADARVRVQEPLQICLECRNKSKKCDKQLTHIVRVSSCNFFKF
jgi:hypothetical protein